MGRRRSVHSAFAAVTLTVVLVGPASAHLGDIVYPVYELPTSGLPNLHDGTLEDWEEALPNASLDHNDFVFQDIGLGGGVDPANLACRVFLAWHRASQKLYVAVERLDDVYLGPREGYTQLRVDGDHSGGQYALFVEQGQEESEELDYVQAQQYAVKPEWNDTDRMVISRPSWTWTTMPPWADAGGFQYGELPNYSAVEFAITLWDDLNWRGPELSRRSALEAGKIIGFQIRVMDLDKPLFSTGDYWLALPTVMGEAAQGDYSVSHDLFAENFVDGELIPCYRGDCSGATTVVRMDSWGRIKASFR